MKFEAEQEIQIQQLLLFCVMRASAKYTEGRQLWQLTGTFQSRRSN